MTRRHRAGRVPAALTATALLLAACSADPAPPDATPADETPSPTSTPTHPSGSTPGDEPTFTPEPGEVVTLPFADNGWATMRQGRYAVHVTPTVSYQVDVPDESRALSGRFLNTPGEAAGVFHVAQALANHTRLPAHPCRDHTTSLVGPTVGDLARALRRQPLLRVSEPRPVTLDGRHGRYVEVTIPDKVDASTCVDGSVSLFEGGDEAEDDGWAWHEGYVGYWWILNVHGERVVIMPQCDASCVPKDMDTLTTMAESVTFTGDQATNQAAAIPSSVDAVPARALPADR